MKYFSCEGRFSRLYAYHIRLLMHFTRVRMMIIPYFIFRNLERMTTFIQRKTPQQQLNNVYHFALIKILVVHQLGLQGITWDDFISHNFFTASRGVSEVQHEGEPSHRYECHETASVLFSSHIRKAPDVCLQRQSECYLHLGWKGPRFLHQHHRNKTKARRQCRMRGLQVSHQVNERPTSFSFMMMIQIQVHKAPNLERSSRSSNQRSKPYSLTWRGLRRP